MKKALSKLKAPGRFSRKGENGRLLVIAGSRQYHGAPAFSILGARRFCDLTYFLPGDSSPTVLQSVLPLPEPIIVSEPVDADCVLYGPGLGKAKFPLSRIRKFKKKVIDGDGIMKLSRKSDFAGTILTPHEGEFRRLFGVPSTPRNVMEFAAEHSCTILKKGPTDLISDGSRLIKNTKGNPGMTKGGTGDVLAGLTAALFCNNLPLVAAASAAYLTGFAGDILFKKQKYAYCASDLAEALPEAYKKAFPGRKK
ncbi:NAD(P)H-hydrate dehydratase [Candidatus Micrarchaeota archaeon]|nr:NAD(P)H-hydrate dehydratase [Candidatus Micrarchaeota archaeon]MBD3418052.1 NAD(P)H-hydrate dehydratase [Candidatus Micrarchaeota archaeon]